MLLVRFLFIAIVCFIGIAFYISYKKGDDIYDAADEIATNFLTNNEEENEL